MLSGEKERRGVAVWEREGAALCDTETLGLAVSVGCADSEGETEGLPERDTGGLRVDVRVAVAVRDALDDFVISRVRVEDAVPNNSGFVGTAVDVRGAVRLGEEDSDTDRVVEGETVEDGEEEGDDAVDTETSAEGVGASVASGLAEEEGLAVIEGEKDTEADQEADADVDADVCAVKEVEGDSVAVVDVDEEAEATDVCVVCIERDA